MTSFLRRKLNDLENIVLKFHPKPQQIYISWLPRHNTFLKREKTYDYSKHPVYKRGMVISVDFGFNVGAEYGGFHWAAVIQNDAKRAQTVVVVPLSSLKPGQNTHPLDAFLGTIDQLNTNDAEALVGQISTVSKMRIKTGQIYKLTDSQMSEIDKKMIQRYVGPDIKKKVI